MFKYSASMSCTPNQYKDYLRAGLLRLGYNENTPSIYYREELTKYVVTGYRDIQNSVALAMMSSGAIYLGRFNPTLFLAVAAMTTSPRGGQGEYWKCTEDFRERFTKGKLYKAIGPLDLGGNIIYDNNGTLVPAFPHPHLPLFRKAELRDITSAAFNKTLK